MALRKTCDTSNVEVPIAAAENCEASIDLFPDPSQSPNSDDDFEASDEPITSSSATAKDLHANQPSLAGLMFTSWKDVTNAVQCTALQMNKQVSCTAFLSGRWEKVYKCVHWLGCRKRHCQQILDLACDKYPSDEHMRAEFIRLNPFEGKGACNYSVVALWNKSKGFHIPSTKDSNFQHGRSSIVITFASLRLVFSIIHVYI